MGSSGANERAPFPSHRLVGAGRRTDKPRPTLSDLLSAARPTHRSHPTPNSRPAHARRSSSERLRDCAPPVLAVTADSRAMSNKLPLTKARRRARSVDSGTPAQRAQGPSASVRSLFHEGPRVHLPRTPAPGRTGPDRQTAGTFAGHQ